MSGSIRRTAAQAMVPRLSVQMAEGGGRFVEGVRAIFGHGNVARIGEALHGIGDARPASRGQNEQTMAHPASACVKTLRRRRAMAVTCSIGPGATRMGTAAALAHVDRLPLAIAVRVPVTGVLTDGRGFGCINRLQIECGGAEFVHIHEDPRVAAQPAIDFVAHARSMGAHAAKAAALAALRRTFH